MNIQKTNKLGLIIAKNGFIGGNNRLAKYNNTKYSIDSIVLNSNLLRHNPNAKIVRVSKGIIDACKMIDIDSIRENINESNFDFQSMFILLDNDNSGVIKVERFGSDISFLLMSNLDNDKLEGTYNSYSFISKAFNIEKEDEGDLSKFPQSERFLNYDNSIFVVQLLTYLIFGEVTENHLHPKARLNFGFTRILNNSNLNITFCDTLWKQRISVDGFKVRGHFRLQPCGEKREKRKLIWIEEFEKQGYNRKATVEIHNGSNGK